MVSIPESVFALYEEFADDFITSNFGVDCKLIYPPKRTTCANCVPSPISNNSGNVYRHGGPAPFSLGVCPLCGSVGFKEVENFEIIKMRVYYNPKEFVLRGPSVHIPDGAIQVIGFLSDVPKLIKCNEIIPNYTTALIQRYKILSPPSPHGFKRRKYFSCLLDRV